MCSWCFKPQEGIDGICTPCFVKAKIDDAFGRTYPWSLK